MRAIQSHLELPYPSSIHDAGKLITFSRKSGRVSSLFCKGGKKKVNRFSFRPSTYAYDANAMCSEDRSGLPHLWIRREPDVCSFIQSNVSVGASGALFGLIGSMLSELITNWSLYANKVHIYMHYISLLSYPSTFISRLIFVLCSKRFVQLDS